MGDDCSSEPVEIPYTPFSEQALEIQKFTGQKNADGWEECETIATIWLPIKVIPVKELEEIVKQHGGDRWRSLAKYR